ncbi:MAG: ribonuclease [Ilumatobacteraceae bacterium]|nr:ribonuclease [Ilumatobacteraceae bacterium]
MAKTFVVPQAAVAEFQRGFDQIRSENDVPTSFPPEVVAAAASAAKMPFTDGHVDRTDIAFVTLDPATSTDLDQAFVIERGAGDDLVLRYAIADVPWFVTPGSALDIEAWNRGVTTYLPDGRAGLYPPTLSEAAVSLLPDGPRPAVVFIVRVGSDGAVVLDGVERAVIRSRAKLAYETATAADLPADFDELAARITAAEDRRGASRVEAPEQEVEPDGSGGYRIAFRPRLHNEDSNAAMSLATNLAVADLLFAHHTGLFRVMAEPDERSVRRLRFTAKALGLSWPDNVELGPFQRTLDANAPKQAAFLMAVRRAGGGADYAPFVDGVVPWHSAMAATYCHATAPLRRLADRYVVEAALAVANGAPVPDHVQAAFARLPEVMDKAESRSSRVERAVIDLVESVALKGREGQTFDAVVTDVDDRGARIQLADPAVVARVSAHHVEPGDAFPVRLVSADPAKRTVTFERIG